MIELKMYPELEKKAGCAMCGKCCEAISIPHSHEDLRKTSMRSGDFILENWKPMTQEEALAINPNLIRSDIEVSYCYSCDMYDKETKLCNAHENRPPVCSAFPFYDNPINNQALLMHKECSYWWDVPVEAWPEGVNPIGEAIYD